MNDLMMMVFVEKPLALLGSANYFQEDNDYVILMLYNSLSLHSWLAARNLVFEETCWD